MHRLDLESISAESGRWMLGVNVVRLDAAALGVELTAAPRHGRSVVVVVLLGPDEAAVFGEAITEAVERVQRRGNRDAL